MLRVAGPLDLTTGLALVDAVRAAAGEGATELEIDLCEVTDWSPEGAAALVDCRDTLEELHYRTNRGAGRDALLAAFADLESESDTGDDGIGSMPSDDRRGSGAAHSSIEIDLRHL